MTLNKLSRSQQNKKISDNRPLATEMILVQQNKERLDSLDLMSCDDYDAQRPSRQRFFFFILFFPLSRLVSSMATFKKTSQAPFSGTICGIGAGYVGGPTMAMVRCFYSIPYPHINSSPVPRIFRKIGTRPVVCLPSVASG